MSKQQNKQKPIFGLNKLPPKGQIKALQEINSELMVDRGKDKSYIEELEHRIHLLEKLTPEQLLSLTENKQVVALKKEIKALNKRINTYNKAQKVWVQKNLELKRKLEDAKAK